MSNTKTLPMVVLADEIILPDTTMAMEFVGKNARETLKYAYKEKAQVFICKFAKGKEKFNGLNDVNKYGVLCNILDLADKEDKTLVRLDGEERMELRDIYEFSKDNLTWVEVEESSGVVFDAEFKERLYKEILYKDVKSLEKLGYAIKQSVWLAFDKMQSVYVIMNLIADSLKDIDKQEYLNESDWELKAQKLSATLKVEIYKRNVMRDIDKKLDETLKENQKEFILREQIRVIKRELGEDESELDDIKKKIEAIKAGEEVKAKLKKELSRMEKMNVTSPEYAIIRNYLDVALSLPWGEYTQDNYDLAHIRDVLDQDHYGIEKVKNRIIEAIAVKKLAGNKNKAPIICLVGSPGVGKTSIAQSIAKALGKEYIHMSLGGIRDEAEIRGHRKTYIGAMPGRIISCMSKAKTSNPLFLFDEIDKMTSDMRGDPSSAMLEVLDPNQNANFRDNYLELPFDLSQVMFIMTANSLSTIQKPLLDRMEVIEMDGYTVCEKVEIAKRYLVPKQKQQNGIEECEVEFEDGAIEAIIDGYTRESGVRELERQIANACRKIATKIVGGDNISYVVTVENLTEYLGAVKYSGDSDIVNGEIGAVNGLAWTSVGGVTMPIEVRLLPFGTGKIHLTGSLGDVMKESAEIALSFVKSKAKELNIDEETFNKNDIHIHVPAGATPKDGPSAGIALATAILSAFTGKSVKDNLAMTGEITLRGKVLAIGGLREKTLAAQRSGIKTVIIPVQNKKDMQELPKGVLDDINFVLADNIATVFECACGVSV
ncbi:MAG: endopeptidase La [Clostridia bacterium]|nr:endopeptidase La [Clostridia bacterium]MDE7328323.1 endopeptidase La [Clostridia bacterium]